MDLNLFVQKLSKMELLISCFLKMLSFLKLICASVEQSPGVVYLTKPFHLVLLSFMIITFCMLPFGEIKVSIFQIVYCKLCDSSSSSNISLGTVPLAKSL